jgi:divalent metal cation (Fe/Co/Zn/Cd) transporter
MPAAGRVKMVSKEHDDMKRRAARFSVLSNSLLVVAKLVVGLVSGSVSVLSEAIHSGIDLIAAIIAWY